MPSKSFAITDGVFILQVHIIYTSTVPLWGSLEKESEAEASDSDSKQGGDDGILLVKEKYDPNSTEDPECPLSHIKKNVMYFISRWIMEKFNDERIITLVNRSGSYPILSNITRKVTATKIVG